MKDPGRIETNTPIEPRAVAEAVWEEASVWLGEPLPSRWRRELIARAQTAFAQNEHFRQKVRGSGDSGRDYLWTFTRHWLAALLAKRRPHLYARLPSSYNVGEALPPRVVPRQKEVLRASYQPLIRSVSLEEAWGAAAHGCV